MVSSGYEGMVVRTQEVSEVVGVDHRGLRRPPPPATMTTITTMTTMTTMRNRFGHYTFCCLGSLRALYFFALDRFGHYTFICLASLRTLYVSLPWIASGIILLFALDRFRH